MSEPEFDPYLKWLGIRDPERPINHYRLLGLDLFESDPDVISIAADRQMAHIRTYQSGPRGPLSQKILGELAIARRCLLMPEQKLAYDQQLVANGYGSSTGSTGPADAGGRRGLFVETSRLGQGDLDPPAAKPITTPIPPVVPVKAKPTSVPEFSPTAGTQVAGGDSFPTAGIGVRADENIRLKRKKKERGNLVITLVGWLTGGLAGLGAGAFALIYLLPADQEIDQGNELGLVVKGNSAAVGGGDPMAQANPGPDSAGPNTTGSGPAKSNPLGGGSIAKPSVDPVDQRPSVNDPNYPWNLANLIHYPKPGDDPMKLIASTQLAADKKHRFRFEPSSQRVGTNDYEQVVSQGGVLIGFEVSRTDAGGLKTLCPIFLNASGAFLGASPVSRGKKSYWLVARPGYAVGELEYSRLSPMAGFRLTYMKIEATGLNPNDRYTSEWFGYKDGPLAKPANQSGLPIVGTYGRYRNTDEQYIASVGLIGLAPPSSTAPPIASADLPSGEPNKPLPSFFPDKQPVTEDDSLNVPPPPMENGEPSVDSGIAVAKAEPPASKEMKAAEKELLELYADQISKANSAAQLQHLARLLLADAQSSPQRDATVFVLLGESTRIATNVGDAKTAVEAIRELDARFEIDYWELVRDAIDDSAKNLSPATATDFKLIIDDLINTAIQKQQFSEADWVVGRALKMARRAGDNSADDDYQKMRKKDQFA